MPSLKTPARLLLLSLVLLAQPAQAEDDLMTSELVDQAREWQQKNRDDLAAEVWRKLLRFNPNHPQALVQLAQIELRAAHLSEAERLYRQASRLTPPPRGLSQLAAALQAAKEPAKQPPPAPAPVPLPVPASAPTKEATPVPPAPPAKPATPVKPASSNTPNTPPPERTETRAPRRPSASPPAAPSDNNDNATPTQGIILKLSPSLNRAPKRP